MSFPIWSAGMLSLVATPLLYDAYLEPQCGVHLVRESSPAMGPSPKPLDHLRAELRSRHDSRKTEKAYVAWVRRFVLSNRKVQELLGHRDIGTTMICTHALNRGWSAVRSPTDPLQEPRGA